jgi:hypothetical protein
MSVPPLPTMVVAPALGPPGPLLSMKRYPNESGPPLWACVDAIAITDARRPTMSATTTKRRRRF